MKREGRDHMQSQSSKTPLPLKKSPFFHFLKIIIGPSIEISDHESWKMIQLLEGDPPPPPHQPNKTPYQTLHQLLLSLNKYTYQNTFLRPKKKTEPLEKLGKNHNKNSKKLGKLYENGPGYFQF